MITIQELLYNRGLSRTARVKLVRHKERTIDLYKMYQREREAFISYQARQQRDVFHGVEYLISFIGEAKSLARFVGVWKIYGRETGGDGFHYYDMDEVDGYEDLKERVIVRWSNAKAWHQWIRNEMEVLEISPGLNYKRFTDYNDLLLDFNELSEIVNNDYSDWHNVLSAIKGVYLITDLNTGKLYVGSAYGEEGIWGRWREYVSTNGHGGNKSLRALTNSMEGYASKYFQFSILMLLPKTVTADEAIAKERLFKQKLGSNSFGLNNN